MLYTVSVLLKLNPSTFKVSFEILALDDFCVVVVLVVALEFLLVFALVFVVAFSLNVTVIDLFMYDTFSFSSVISPVIYIVFVPAVFDVIV